MEITLAIAIIGCVLSVASFAIGRKDKSNETTEKDSYKQGIIDEKLKTIMEKLDKIENKLDNMENETKKIVQQEIEKHILAYHKKGE